MTSKRLLSSEKSKKRSFSDDYQSLPDVQIEECHKTRQVEHGFCSGVQVHSSYGVMRTVGSSTRFFW